MEGARPLRKRQGAKRGGEAMSGFFAIRSERGPVDPHVVDAVVRASAHRGAPAMWTDDCVALVAFGGGLHVAENEVVVADARVDNLEGNTAEILLDAWRRDRLRSVIGDFAGVVWDRRRKELHVFRDPCAGRAALLGESAAHVSAGSSIPMLLANPAIGREIDGAWVRAYLAGEAGFARATGYAAIQRCEPGSVATARGGRWRQRTYFEFSFARTREPDDAAYGARLRELLVEATRVRVAGARRVGVSLSGGLDSTSVAACLREAAPQTERVALSVPFTDPAADERELQKQVADHLGMTLRWAPLGESPFGDSPVATLQAIGTPPIAPNQFFVDAVVEAGAQERVDVALDGIDGDGLLGGNWFFLADLFATGRAFAFAKELKAAARRHGASRKQMLRAAVFEPLRRDPMRAGRLFATEEKQSMSAGVLPAVVETIDEQWARRGIRAAHPFLDRRVVEFCLGLPREQKVRLGLTKVALRNGANALLPAKVTARAEKAELGSSLLSAIGGQSFHMVETGLDLALSNPFPWVEPERVAQLAEQFRRDREGIGAFRVAYVAFWRDWLHRGVLGGTKEDV